MTYMLRLIQVFVLLLSIMMISSCNYRKIAKENEALEKEKSELASEVASLKAKIDEDPDDHHALLEQAKSGLERTEKKHKALESEVASFQAKETKLKKQFALDKVRYVIK